MHIETEDKRNGMARRSFLKGVGTVLALPLLDAMIPTGVMAASAKKSPTRLAYIFTPNGMHMPEWTPKTQGANFELPSILEPLKNVRGEFSVLSGLTQNNASALGDGGGDHARSTATWLTGIHVKKTAGADIHNGVSADQIAAQKYSQLTKFGSLELGCERGAQAGDCDTGYSCAYSSSISWRGPATPNAHEVDPRAVFERLFGVIDPTETPEMRTRRDRYRKSILDNVLEDAGSLKTKLGYRDLNKLDEYFTGVREIEQRLVRAEQFNAASKITANDRPTGVPGDYGDHIRLLCDMMVLAFQSDLTRVVTFMFANDGSNRSYKEIGVPEGHHDCSHHGHDPAKQEKVRTINHFHVTQLAYLLEKLKATPDGDGNLLDHSMIVYGAGISDGDRHNHDQLPILLAGRGSGTVKQGRHIAYADGTPMNNLHLSLLDRMGVRAETLGDSTGRLNQLF